MIDLVTSSEIITTEGEMLAVEIMRQTPAYSAIITRFEVQDDIAHLRGELRLETRDYDIAQLTINPNYLGLGISEELLKQATQEARVLGASRMIATIVHPNCLSAMRGVFGEAAINDLNVNTSYAQLDFPL